MCKYTVQRQLGRNGWEDISASMPKKAAEQALKKIRATRKRIGLDDGKFKIEYQIWPALPEKVKAVELWWAIKNIGASRRDEPRFLQMEDQPLLMPTKRECDWFLHTSFRCSSKRNQSVRVEVREL
jgi:hypothetical protein